jgi:hypothetical protein
LNEVEQAKRLLKSLFFTATRARERWKQRLIETVMEAADRDAKHAEWLLERQFPHEFAPFERRPIPAEVEAVEGKQVSIALVLNTDLKSLQEVAAFPVRSVEEPPGKALSETEHETEVEPVHYNRNTKRFEPIERKPEIEPIDNGEHED